MVTLKHFTARDIISRWDVVSVYHQATAATASDFLDELEARMPFSIGGYLTPLEFLKQRQEKSRKEYVSLRY
jgi:hypothetical protein